MKKKIGILLGCVICVLLAGYSVHTLKVHEEHQKYEIALNDSVGYGASLHVKDLVTDSLNVELLNGEETVDTSKLGEFPLTVRFRQIYTGEEMQKDITVKVSDKDGPVITVLHDSEQIVKGQTIDLLPYAIVEDNLDDHVILELEGDYDYKTAGKYEVKFVATDNSGNRSEAPFTLFVYDSADELQLPYPHHEKGYDYKLVVNIHNQTVRVFRWDGTDYNDLLKIFTCSTGTSTPKRVGTWKTPVNYRWKWLFGDVYGQYATRIISTCLFHSVPYFTANPDDLEYLEYNKLGTPASMGCVRLRVIDVKWIYDNCPIGTTVVIHDDPTDTVPVQWLAQIDVNSPNRGWDPTDPDENNPWHKTN